MALTSESIDLTYTNNGINSELIVLICRDSFELDWREAIEPLDDKQLQIQCELFKRWQEDPYEALFHFGFKRLSVPVSDSLHFLYTITSAFIESLSKKPEIEFLREKISVEPEHDELEKIMNSAPYMNGTEYLDIGWITDILQKLCDVFRAEISGFRGSVADYFASLSPDVHMMGRIFFHLVESKKDDFPFAFLATYSSIISNEGKIKHLPLKNALVEYKNDSKKLLELLSTVNKASQNSTFISELVKVQSL